ncbi:MAG: hypothetical protein WAM14_05060 [Candidatus Nitrosopolaris sp.]
MNDWEGVTFFIQRIISIYNEMRLLWSGHVTRQGIGKHYNLQMQRMRFKQFYAKGHSLIFEARRLETFVNQCWLLDGGGCRSSSGFHCDKGGSCCLSFPLETTDKYAHVIFTSLSGLDTIIFILSEYIFCGFGLVLQSL